MENNSFTKRAALYTLAFGLNAAFVGVAANAVSASNAPEDFKNIADKMPAFTQIHNEAIAYDYIRISTIGSEISSLKNDGTLSEKLSNVQDRLDDVIPSMMAGSPGTYDFAIKNIRDVAIGEVTDGMWTKASLEAYADAALELDLGIARMGDFASKKILADNDVSAQDADRMTAVTLAYSIGDMAEAWHGDLEDGFRNISDVYENAFADLTGLFQKVDEANFMSIVIENVTETSGAYQFMDPPEVVDPFALPQVESDLDDAPELD